MPPASGHRPRRVRGLLDAGAWRTLTTADQQTPLLERERARLWCPIPGMYGGFSITFATDADELDVRSSRRVVGGSGQMHRIRPDGYELVGRYA
ncbi:hypothetical protein ACWEVD_08610 [Nocardia thailandica]